MLKVNGRAYDWGDVDFQMPGLKSMSTLRLLSPCAAFWSVLVKVTVLRMSVLVRLPGLA